MKIICVGRNYAKHAAELKNEMPTEPVIFLKPETALVPKHNPFFLPEFSNDVHHEIELVVKINRVGKHIQPKFAHKYYDEISVGIDFTARDLQAKLKEKGLPWEKAKAFDGSAFVGKWKKKADLGNLEDLNLRLEVNDETRQDGNTSDMLWTVDELISHVSQYFTLKKGDLIFTGTPEGVAKVEKDDRLHLYLNNELLGRVNVK